MTPRLVPWVFFLPCMPQTGYWRASSLKMPTGADKNSLKKAYSLTRGLRQKGQTSKMEPRRQWHPTLVLLPGKSHGRRSLVGCSPWGREESDMTERLHCHFSLLCSGEGNGNPLQGSCLGNPRDGVAQSQTQLK